MKILGPRVLENSGRSSEIESVFIQSLMIFIVGIVLLIHVEGKKIHPSLVECIVDFRDHSFEFPICRV